HQRSATPTRPPPGPKVLNTFHDTLKSRSVDRGLVGDQPLEKDFRSEDFEPDVGSRHGVDQGHNLGDLRKLIATSAPGDVRSQLDGRWVESHSDWFNHDGSLKQPDQIAALGDGEKYNSSEISTGLGTIAGQLDTTGNSDHTMLETHYGNIVDDSPEAREW
ncbi:hypothetical protein ACIGKQ_23405, partial [Gordonia sp. NPDC062954]|uniref:hypothetical protein n=1 Tax=Gordonia sp. NPDC062954 TaxID=3364003 RepID=UPI0037C655C4